MLRAIPSRRRSLLATGLFVAAWLFVFPYFAQMNNPNENIRLYMTAALVEQGSYEISPQRRTWGWVNDAACVQELEGALSPCEGAKPAGAERRYYSVKAPLTSWLGVPGYWIAKGLAHLSADAPEGDADAPVTVSKASALWWVRLTGSGIPCAIFLFFFYGFLGRLTSSAQARDLTFVAFALGSVFLGYAYIFASHATSAVAAGGAFMLLVHFEGERRKASGDGGTTQTFRRRVGAWLLVAWAGFLTAAATALEYPCFFFSLALSIYALFAIRPWPRILAFGLGALIPTLLVAHFQHVAFGNPLSPGHLYVENDAFRAGHEQGFFGADGFHWKAAWSLLLSPREGLFTSTPFFIFALFGVRALWRRRKLATAIAVGACFITYLAICVMQNWDGGWVIGPRYLVALLPFIGMACVVGVEQIQRRFPATGQWVLAFTLLLSFASSGLLSVLYPHVPQEIDWPLAHLAWPLLKAGRAPHTALELLGITGALTLVPLAALAALGVRWAHGRIRLGVWLTASLCAASLLWVSTLPEPDGASNRAYEAVETMWEPR